MIVTAINCGYTQWSEWGLCSQTCGTGVQERSRSDNNPSPAFGGQLCDQSTQETKSCQIEPCPGKYLFWSCFRCRASSKRSSHLLMLAFSIENCNLEVTWLKLKAVNVFLFVCLSNYLFFCFLFFYLFVCLFADLILSFSKLIISDLSSPFSWVLEKPNRLS